MPKGIYKHKPNRTSWKKGEHPSPNTEFKKGCKGGKGTLGRHWKIKDTSKMGGNSGKNHRPKFHTEKTKTKQRVARLKYKLPTRDTSIELKVKDYLEKKKVKYIQQFNLGNKFQCDFYLPDRNLIVECDGTYWHSRPDMKRRDKAKDAYAKKCGFNMLRLTESEINKSRFVIN